MDKERIGLLGPAGSYSGRACEVLYPPKENQEYVLCKDVPTMLAMVRAGELDRAMLPMASSNAGMVVRDGKEVLSYLLEGDLYIVGEIYWKLQFYLIGKFGSHIEDIKTVHTFEGADSFCSAYFARHPNWQIQYHPSSSEAARAASELASSADAALASMDAVRQYHLEVLDDRIFLNDFDYPIMHYMTVAKKPLTFESIDNPNNFISAFVFSCDEHGTLKRLLQEAQLGLFRLHRFGNTNKYYLALHGVYDAAQVKSFTGAYDIKRCGLFHADPQRKAFAPLFYEAIQ